MNVYRVRVIGGQIWEVEANDKIEARAYLSNNYPWQTVIRGSEIVLALNMTLAEYMRQEAETENPLVMFYADAQTVDAQNIASLPAQPTEQQPTCETCRFFEVSGDHRGYCKQSNPQLFVDYFGRNPNFRSAFPEIHCDDWCGQHQFKQKGGA